MYVVLLTVVAINCFNYVKLNTYSVKENRDRIKVEELVL
jgi:hypothetical protein